MSYKVIFIYLFIFFERKKNSDRKASGPESKTGNQTEDVHAANTRNNPDELRKTKTPQEVNGIHFSNIMNCFSNIID